MLILLEFEECLKQESVMNRFCIFKKIILDITLGGWRERLKAGDGYSSFRDVKNLMEAMQWGEAV